MAFDWRRFFGVPLGAATALGVGGMRWPEVLDLLLELRRETGSHFYANLAEQRLAVPLEGVYGIALAVASMNQWRGRSSEPLKMPDLFMSPAEAVPVTAEDRERAEAMLSNW